MTTTLHINAAADVIAVLPYELGYHPRDSLVAVAIRGNRLGLRARVDLPPGWGIEATVGQLLPPLTASDADGVLLLGYETAEGDSTPMLDAMAEACEELGFDVRAQLVVRDGRWYQPDCTDPRCCPPEGRPVPTPEQVPAVAEFVAREKQPLQDREALAAELRPDRPLLAAAVDGAVDRWLDRSTGRAFGAVTGAGDPGEDHRAELAAWSRLLDTSDGAVPVGDLPPQELAVLAVSLLDVELRDGLISWLCPGMVGVERPDTCLDLRLRAALPPLDAGDEMGEAVAGQRLEARLMRLCRCLPARWAVAPLTVLASFTWWRGDGALTRLALEQALETEPDYRLALLLLRMVDLSVRPHRASA